MYCYLSKWIYNVDCDYSWFNRVDIGKCILEEFFDLTCFSFNQQVHQFLLGESAAYNKVDKFIDVLFTKGPKAIGAFHEALAKTYPGLFDYLTRLFTGAGIDLPESRRSELYLDKHWFEE